MPHFADTNVVAYAFSDDARRLRAADIVDGATTSIQVLNELTLVARRKWKRKWAEVDALIARTCSSVHRIVPMDEAVHAVGRQLAERYQLAVYDSFVVAAALLSNCDVLYSEDMQNGLVIEGALTIRNPFA